MGRSGHASRAGAPGRVGWALTDLQGRLRAGELEGESFYAASTMKVAVLIEAFRWRDRGELSLEQPVRVRVTFPSRVAGAEFSMDPEDWDQELQDMVGAEVPMGWLLERMITRSSNEATNLVLSLVGFGGIARLLPELGAGHSRVERMIDDTAAERAGISNRVTPQDLCSLMAAIASGRAAGAESCRRMVEILCRQQYREEIPAALPAGTRVANKTGWMSEVLHDTAVVWPGDAEPYCLTVLTQGFGDPERARARVRQISAWAWGERAGPG